jgi:hypothetical protein
MMGHMMRCSYTQPADAWVWGYVSGQWRVDPRTLPQRPSLCPPPLQHRMRGSRVHTRPYGLQQGWLRFVFSLTGD